MEMLYTLLLVVWILFLIYVMFHVIRFAIGLYGAVFTMIYTVYTHLKDSE